MAGKILTEMTHNVSSGTLNSTINYIFSLSTAVSQEAMVDSSEKVVTTPAFMCEAGLHEIFDGIGAMIGQVLTLAASSSK